MCLSAYNESGNAYHNDLYSFSIYKSADAKCITLHKNIAYLQIIILVFHQTIIITIFIHSPVRPTVNVPHILSATLAAFSCEQQPVICL